MISERAFAAHFSTFWRATLPNLEAVLRTLNLAAEREFTPLRSNTQAGRRDIISETGFRLFGLQLEGREQHPSIVNEAFDGATTFLGGDFTELASAEITEAKDLARRLLIYARQFGSKDVTFLPFFPGHGMISPCYGDVAAGSCLIEIKYVDRSFRSTDLRQLLCYCALRHFSANDDFSDVSLFNPFRGVSITVGVGELISGASGRSEEEFYQEFSYVLSSGEISR